MFVNIAVLHHVYGTISCVLLVFYGTDGCYSGRSCQVASARRTEGKQICLLMFEACAFF